MSLLESHVQRRRAIQESDPTIATKLLLANLGRTALGRVLFGGDERPSQDLITPLYILTKLCHPISALRRRMDMRSEARDWNMVHEKFSDFASRLESEGGSFSFMQIGAKDGKENDPMHPMIMANNWAGVLVEPRAAYFKKLKKTYEKKTGLNFVQAAITESTGYATISVPRSNDPALDRMLSGGATLREGLQFPGWAEASIDRIDHETVSTLSLDDLVEVHCGGIMPDLLFIDAEGYDAAIIAQLKDATQMPQFIVFEHAGISPDELVDCTKFLGDSGYDMTIMRHDILAERLAA